MFIWIANTHKQNLGEVLSFSKISMICSDKQHQSLDIYIVHLTIIKYN